jgi:hypothetical protein
MGAVCMIEMYESGIGRWGGNPGLEWFLID